MDFSTLLDQARGWLTGAWTQFEAMLNGSPLVAGVGILLALTIGFSVAALILASVFKLVAVWRRSSLAAKVKRDTEVGARILLVKGNGGRQKAISAYLKKAIENHLKDYMFGGPFRIAHYPGGLHGDEAAIKLMKRTDADLILWAETPRGSKGGVARILARPVNTFESQRPPWTLELPKDRATWGEPLCRAMAYASAKMFRPALGRPQDFRAERLEPVVNSLNQILSYRPKADPKLLAEMVDDASAGALQMAFAGDDSWVDRSVEVARSTLAEINRSAAPDRWIAANITLGRALRLKAEKRFDPVMLREGMSYLSEALEALRSEPRFKLAESAAQAIGEAQKLLGTRRKFSISGGGL
jgi:hypothetical protein